MGTEFAIIYDIVAVAIMIGMVFAGMKKGFASAVVSLVSVIVAFAAAMLLSGPISGAIYTGTVERPVKKTVNIALDEAMGAIKLEGIADIDYSAILVSDVPVADITPDYTGTNKAMFDLSDLDLSATGIDKLDLSDFGIPSDTDFSSVNAKTAEFTMTDIDRYGLDRMIVAQYIAVSMQKTVLYENFSDFAESVGEAVPMFFGSMAGDISSGSIPALRSVVLIMQDASVSIRDAVIEGIVEPCVTIAVQTVTFTMIFILVLIGLSIAAKLLKFVNKIPLIGGVNSLLGGLLGIVEGLVTVCMACIVVRLITTLSGGNVMFFNNAAIESTYVFRLFYDFEFLNFLK